MAKDNFQDRIKVLEYMREHGSITVREAEEHLKINSPTKTISRMRKIGYPIKDRWEQNPKTGKKYKTYYLEEIK